MKYTRKSNKLFFVARAGDTREENADLLDRLSGRLFFVPRARSTRTHKENTEQRDRSVEWRLRGKLFFVGCVRTTREENIDYLVRLSGRLLEGCSSHLAPGALAKKIQITLIGSNEQ